MPQLGGTDHIDKIKPERFDFRFQVFLGRHCNAFRTKDINKIKPKGIV